MKRSERSRGGAVATARDHLGPSAARLAAALALVLCAGGCPRDAKPTPDQAGPGGADGKSGPGQPAPAASARIEARSGSSVSGAVTFTPVEGHTRLAVRVEVKGASPGLHGVHIHEKGDCSDPEAKSAGGHFNPAGVPHGGPDAPAHHPGDFGNITIGEDGTGALELTTSALTVATQGEQAASSVIGRAIIVHEKPDDLVTQPTGNAGGRIGCGVIAAGGL